ncbi:MAG: COP23 domain-containing protein [Stigonema ocellatum SAG 48.90 = DSM 106950]|nr:COP23 domain-containing protein [Stigonema ocellatum SAG 48.90 = DSM 106950]
MTDKKLFEGLTVAIITLGVIPITSQPSLAERAPGSFFCDNYYGTPTTMVRHPSRGNVPFIRWVKSFAPDWTPEQRCKQVSQKFQQNQQSGILRYIVPGKSIQGGLPVLCASQELSSQPIPCPNEQVLMTLRRGENSQELIKKFVDINTNASKKGIVEHQGAILQCHQSVSKLINGRLQCPKNAVQGIDVETMITQLK